MNDIHQLLFENKLEDTKNGDFDFTQVWENIDSEYNQVSEFVEACKLIVSSNLAAIASALALGEQPNSSKIEQTPLSAFIGDIAPAAAAVAGVEESPMMSTPYLDSNLNTPFTPATLFTPSLNQFQNSPYYSPYIESSNNIFNNPFAGVDSQDIQVAKYLKNDLSWNNNDPCSSASKTPSVNNTESFDSLNDKPSLLLNNTMNNIENSSDFLFPPLPSESSTSNTLNEQDALHQDVFKLSDDLFEFDDSLFNITDDLHHEDNSIPSIPMPMPMPTKKRKSEDRDMKKANKRIKVDKNCDRKHECPICHATFNRRYNLGTHIKTHDKNRQKDFSCHLCNKTFDRKHDLSRHIATVHNGERAYSCNECTSTFSRKDAMVRHKVQKHGYQP